MTTAYPLSMPGDVSGWISLGEAFARASDGNDAITDKLRGVEVRVRVLSRRDVIRLRDESRKAVGPDGAEPSAERELAMLDADEQWIKSGLVSMRGVGRDVDAVDDDVLEALASSHLSWLVAMVVRTYNDLDADARPGFFTPAQVG